MELVEGETLEDRLGRGPIPLNEALQIARQIIDALEAAHERGIIHRDLKPATIKVGAGFRFGESDRTITFGRRPNSSQWIDSRHGGNGRLRVDGTGPRKSRRHSHRYLAFGCVLFEMLTTKPVFDGETVTDIIAKIVQSEPPWNLLPSDLPSSVRILLEAALRKDLKQRLQHIGDARLFLNQSTFQAAPTTVVARPSERHGSYEPLR
jgi:serine/threonine protein kinase